MTDECIFCEVVAGRRDDEIVYSDDLVIAFLDNLRQPNPGHVLVIPRAHSENIWTIDEGVGNSLLRAAKLVSQALKDTLDCDGITLWVSNGPGAAQEVLHFHLHVFPRRTGDGFFKIYPELPLPVPPREELAEIAGPIRRRVRDLAEVSPG